MSTIKPDCFCGAPSLRPTPAAQARRGQRRVESRTLFESDREIIIHHQGSDYLLRITSQNKLILTK